ncbi:MAG: RMD1 family protein [Candidatus Diapherotrites archaeon]|nr:RMD1 family protein [Candidatus Diapherotrites archaeon]
MKVVALSVGREFDEERLSRLFPGKVISRWEEPMVLDVHGKEVHLYAFGSVVFFDYDEEIALPFLEKLREAAEGSSDVFREEYEWIPEGKGRGRPLRINGAEVWVTEEAIYGPLDEKGRKVLSFVLAQSASLRRVEKETDELLELIENLLEELSSKSFILSLRGVRRSLIEALRTRNLLLNDLLILEKPPATWEDVGYELLFERLRYVFDVDERYSRIVKKLDYVLETAQIASELVSDARFFLLEFLIVLFFFVEIITLFLMY